MSVLGAIREGARCHPLWTPGEMVMVGVSGGPDSLCLLHALRALSDELGIALHVGHLDHGTREGASAEDARFVADLCVAWGLPCTVERADVPKLARERGISFEEAARQARYRFLGDLAQSQGGCSVAVAHHADDQVETVLMHFLRGSGLAGLRGMMPVSWVDDLRLGAETRPDHRPRVRLVRPLLAVTRAEIEAYCREHGLAPRYDRSNLDTTYFRNRLRHELIPLLEGYNPSFQGAVRRMAAVVAEDYAVLDQLVADTWERVVSEASGRVVVYRREAFLALPLGLRRSLVRRGIHHLRFSLRNIDWVHVEDAVRVASQGRVGAEATLPRGLMLRVGYDELVLADREYVRVEADWPRVDAVLPLPRFGCCDLQRGWRLAIDRLPIDAVAAAWRRNPDRYTAYLDAEALAEPLVLRPRREGDRFSPLGLPDHRQKVSDFMINMRVPQHERACVPLLVSDGRIAWIVGWRIDARFAIQEATRQVAIVRLSMEVP